MVLDRNALAESRWGALLVDPWHAETICGETVNGVLPVILIVEASCGFDPMPFTIAKSRPARTT